MSKDIKTHWLLNSCGPGDVKGDSRIGVERIGVILEEGIILV
jgi:hypothetical protein